MHSGTASLRVNLTTIRNNYDALKRIAPGAELAAVVKSNCYGLGLAFVSPILEQTGCKSFFVRNINEGIALRKIISKSANIYVLDGVYYDSLEGLTVHDIVPVLNNPDQLHLWQSHASQCGKKLKAIFHVDTGMNRLGFSCDSFAAVALRPDLYEMLEIEYIMSHMSSTAIPDSPENERQFDSFSKVKNLIPGVKATLANSGGSLLGQKYHFDMVRVGAGIYGAVLSLHRAGMTENPVSLTAPLIQIRTINRGDKVGYKGTYVAQSQVRLGTIPIGYADGFFSSFSSLASVFIDDIRVPVIGRISMELTTIDLTELPEEKCFLGQEVEILGKNQAPSELAQVLGSTGGEITTALHGRYKVEYTQ